MTLRQILYISSVSGTLSKAAEGQILGISRRNNRRADITGILASSGRHFVQALEGPSEQIEATLKRIDQDPRHVGLTVLFDRLVEARRFEGWSMAYIYNLDLADELAALFAGQGSLTGQDVLDRLHPDSLLGSL